VAGGSQLGGVKTEPIVPARVHFSSEGAPAASEFSDVYHPREGAAQQARDIFLAGNGLPERWRGRARFTILETGFGLGTNFLAAWAAWRDDPQRCERLHFVSLEKHPLVRDDLAHALAASPWPALARLLLEAWPPLTPGLHQLAFESGRVQLLLGLGDATVLARALVARVDAFFLDGFAPARNPAMWSDDLFKALARQAAPDATAATWSAARVVRDGLARAGFEVQAAAGPGRKRDITLARFAPRFIPPRPAGRAMPARAPSHALVIGAGLAGAATARALAQQGVPCTVLDGAAEPAAGASGNPAGLFHGTVGGDDTRYTRWHRAASFSAARWWREAGTPGAADGLLRLSERQDLDAMRALVTALRLSGCGCRASTCRRCRHVRRARVPVSTRSRSRPGASRKAAGPIQRRWCGPRCRRHRAPSRGAARPTCDRSSATPTSGACSMAKAACSPKRHWSCWPMPTRRCAWPACLRRGSRARAAN
jgi:tRNA 5-methylaminomethyl-2-thiouridine biosynthesis bifunctional protein